MRRAVGGRRNQFRVCYRGLRPLRQHHPILRFVQSQGTNPRLRIIQIAIGAILDRLSGIDVALDSKAVKMSSDRTPKYRQEIQQVSRGPIFPFAIIFGCMQGYPVCFSYSLLCLGWFGLSCFLFQANIRPNVRLIGYTPLLLYGSYFLRSSMVITCLRRAPFRKYRTACVRSRKVPGPSLCI